MEAAVQVWVCVEEHEVLACHAAEAQLSVSHGWHVPICLTADMPPTVLRNACASRRF